MVKVNLAERDPAHGNSDQCLAKHAIEVDAHHLLQPWLLVGVEPFCFWIRVSGAMLHNRVARWK
jgi:hypothetical protein